MANQTSDGAGRGQMRLRCAIYTRKSSEEGLEQDFNSLDAQREACEAFIASQKHEGWNILPEMYDDGGFSGGTIERPAFQRLLTDVSEGKIDVVVVYKVDRLTRSLSDFAKIVEIFDKRNVSFVSVTQQFNTTSSMGRLTLNILLSFAQFEREVTGERIRDKIAASKKKGMWMGGLPSLGYDVKDRRLVINEPEAKIVRQIFRRYAELKSVRLLKTDLDALGIVGRNTLARVLYRSGEQRTRDIIAIADIILCRMRRSHSLATCIEKDAGQQANLLFGRAKHAVGPVCCEDCLNLAPEGFIDDGLMFAGIAFFLVYDLAAIDPVLQHEIERAAGKRFLGARSVRRNSRVA
jgi:DNA invertase Pin-like site-specific DNA recombinase